MEVDDRNHCFPGTCVAVDLEVQTVAVVSHTNQVLVLKMVGEGAWIVDWMVGAMVSVDCWVVVEMSEDTDAAVDLLGFHFDVIGQTVHFVSHFEQERATVMGEWALIVELADDLMLVAAEKIVDDAAAVAKVVGTDQEVASAGVVLAEVHNVVRWASGAEEAYDVAHPAEDQPVVASLVVEAATVVLHFRRLLTISTSNYDAD